jgi:hypothetical protein
VLKLACGISCMRIRVRTMCNICMCVCTRTCIGVLHVSRVRGCDTITSTMLVKIFSIMHMSRHEKACMSGLIKNETVAIDYSHTCMNVHVFSK